LALDDSQRHVKTWPHEWKPKFPNEQILAKIVFFHKFPM